MVSGVVPQTVFSHSSKTIGHMAFQFNVEGEAEGTFYLEISDGKINVESYEYYDRDTIIVTSADIIMQRAEGKLKPRVAYTNGQLKVYGDVEQLNVLPLGCEYKVASKAALEKKETEDTKY